MQSLSNFRLKIRSAALLNLLSQFSVFYLIEKENGCVDLHIVRQGCCSEFKKKKPRRKRSVVCRSGHYIEDLIMLPMRSIQRPKQEHTDRWVPIHIQIAEIDWWKRFSKKMKTAHYLLSWLNLLSITDSGGVLWSYLQI